MKRLTNFHFRALAILSLTALCLYTNLPTALALGSWGPTLLVNTESFQSIENGDTTTNIELQFGRATLKGKLLYDITNNRFKFDRDLMVGGTITATGAAIIKGQISGASLRIESNAGIFGNLSVTGSVKVLSNAKFRANLSGASLNVDGYASFNGNVTASGTLRVKNGARVIGNLSGSSLNVDGRASVSGVLSATGAIKTESGITINSKNTTNDANLIFGNNTAAQTLKFINSTQRFQFSKGLNVQGNLSGYTLRVSGSGVNINNVNYTFTGTQGSANTFLKNDGVGGLTWATTSAANGSGGIVEYHAEYPNAVYFASGSTSVGQLSTDYDSSNKENFYHWVSTKAALNDYWISTRLKVPKNFSNWTSGSGITIRYRTTSTSNTNNYINVRLLDTAGAIVATGSGQLVGGAASVWRTTALTNITSGTYTAGSAITLLVKLASNVSGSADIGRVNFNWSTTTP